MNLAITWTNEKYYCFLDYLKTKQDNTYREFNQKIVHTSLPMLGIRTPLLRQMAKEISKKEIVSFLDCSKDDSYEEVLLQGFVIGHIKDDQLSFSYFEKFIQKIDNWAICDMVVSSMKIVKQNRDIYWKRIQEMLNSCEVFVVRVGLVLLLDYYLEPAYLHDIFELVDKLNREEYYINMAVAWLLSVCYIKYKEETSIYLEHNQLSKFTYNKTIQKIVESNRISKEEKEELKKKKRP